MAKMKPVCDWSDVPVIFDIPFCCALLGKSYDRMKKMCQKREIPAFKIGSEWRFNKSEVMHWASSGTWNGGEGT